jgi:FtsZ-binding cell division protein ZapB
MSDPLNILETKIRKVVDEISALRRENERLKSECATLKSQIDLTTGEDRKVQRVLADYDQMKRSHAQVTVRVERALQKLNTLRMQ